MANVNAVVIFGNLTKDPELRHTPSGTSVCNLRIAHNDRVKIDGEWTDVPYYFSVTVWGKQGEACAEHLTKGRGVVVQGRLTWREWEAGDGTKRQATDIVAERVQWLPSKDGQTESRFGGADYSPSGDFAPPAGAAPGSSPSPSSEQPFGGDDDIPFATDDCYQPDTVALPYRCRLR